MPFKDPGRMAEYMRRRRAAMRVNVNPNVNLVNRKPSVNTDILSFLKDWSFLVQFPQRLVYYPYQQTCSD